MGDWPCLRGAEDGAVLELSIQPKASRNALVGVQDGTLKVRLTAPPVEGAANKACLELLAKTFAIPKTRVVLLKGAKSRRKTVLLQGLAPAEAARILDGLPWHP